MTHACPAKCADPVAGFVKRNGACPSTSAWPARRRGIRGRCRGWLGFSLDLSGCTRVAGGAAAGKGGLPCGLPKWVATLPEARAFRCKLRSRHTRQARPKQARAPENISGRSPESRPVSAQGLEKTRRSVVGKCRGPFSGETFCGEVALRDGLGCRLRRQCNPPRTPENRHHDSPDRSQDARVSPGIFGLPAVSSG